jgi:hypothetical protein
MYTQNISLSRQISIPKDNDSEFLHNLPDNFTHVWVVQQFIDIL